MLDFYLLRDEEPKAKSPEQLGLKFAGCLDTKTFDNLQKKGIIDPRFDYYTDFRLSTTWIKQIRQTILQKNLATDSDVKKLLEIFERAQIAASGLIAYAD